MGIVGGETGARTRPWTREARAEKTPGKDEGKLAWTSKSRREARGERRKVRGSNRRARMHNMRAMAANTATPLILAPQCGSVQPAQASHSSLQLQLGSTQPNAVQISRCALRPPNSHAEPKSNR